MVFNVNVQYNGGLLPDIILLTLCGSIREPFQYHVIGAGRPGSSEVPRNPLTRWDVSSIPANGIFLTKKLKN